VVLYEAYDDRAEASYAVDTILSMMARKQAAPGDFAVMYRTNAQSRLIEEAFLQAGLPYKLVGAQRFYGRKEIKDVIAYLRLVHNPSDEISLTRVINAPPRGIGNKTFLALRTQAQKMGLSPGALLLEMDRNGDLIPADVLAGRARTVLMSFGSLLASWVGIKSSLPPLTLMDRILEEANYHHYVDDGTEEGHERWENVLELRRLAADFQDQGLEAFLEQVALVSDQDTLQSTANAPTLLTLHAAKGLEFPIVMITGLSDGTLPHSRSFDDPEAMLEERRLLYVGITRAMDRLFLTYPQNRSAYGYSEPVSPSRYLEDIPFDLIDEEQPSRSPRRPAPTRAAYRPERWQMPSAERDRVHDRGAARADVTRVKGRDMPEQHYSPGMRVEHPSFGEGMVLNSRLQDGDEVVDIHFERVGLKRVVASLAHLEIKV
jgi:DNA helicase-2/ATP-dependent DNA helicase PcrA